MEPISIEEAKNIARAEYGTQYFEAVDDKGDIWTVKYRLLDPSKPYFMYSKTHPVAVDPIIIEKIF